MPFPSGRAAEPWHRAPQRPRRGCGSTCSGPLPIARSTPKPCGASSHETHRWREMDSNHRSPVMDQLVETVLFDFPAEARKRTIGGRRSQPRDLGGDLRRDHALRDDNDRLGWGRRQAQNGGSPDGGPMVRILLLQRGVTCEPEFSQDRSSRPISRGGSKGRSLSLSGPAKVPERGSGMVVERRSVARADGSLADDEAVPRRAAAARSDRARAPMGGLAPAQILSRALHPRLSSRPVA
jgi:hypothetical protein